MILKALALAQDPAFPADRERLPRVGAGGEAALEDDPSGMGRPDSWVCFRADNHALTEITRSSPLRGRDWNALYAALNVGCHV
jgi:hypothetical protein